MKIICNVCRDISKHIRPFKILSKFFLQIYEYRIWKIWAYIFWGLSFVTDCVYKLDLFDWLYLLVKERSHRFPLLTRRGNDALSWSSQHSYPFCSQESRSVARIVFYHETYNSARHCWCFIWVCFWCESIWKIDYHGAGLSNICPMYILQSKVSWTMVQYNIF